MGPVTPVKYTTPDGVERLLRFTFAAQRRIVDRLGCTANVALHKYQNGALPEMLFACMYDEQGRPPQDLDPVTFAETADPEDAAGMMAAFMSAVGKGKVPKNELEALIRQEMQDSLLTTAMNSGYAPGASPESASASATPSSGISPSGNSTPSGNDSKTSSESDVYTPV